MKKAIPIIGITIGILLILGGLGTEIPSGKVDTFSAYEYVGGDAYNYIIAASIQGGKIAGATISRSVYVVGGLIITLLSSMKLASFKEEKEDNKVSTNVTNVNVITE